MPEQVPVREFQSLFTKIFCCEMGEWGGEVHMAGPGVMSLGIRKPGAAVEGHNLGSICVCS